MLRREMLRRERRGVKLDMDPSASTRKRKKKTSEREGEALPSSSWKSQLGLREAKVLCGNRHRFSPQRRECRSFPPRAWLFTFVFSEQTGESQED